MSKRSQLHPGSEKNNAENNPRCFACYHCRVSHRRCTAAIRVPSRAERYHLSTTGAGIRAGERLSQVGGVESVGEDGSQDETNFRGRAPAGTGGVYSWSGNKEVGEGRMTITESRPNELIRIRLDFFKPFAATSIAEFTFKPEGNQTAVTWSMSGDKNFMAKAIHLFMNMDNMIGNQFEKGLVDMKAAAEATTKG
jgi:hypothetical protein